MGGGGAGAPTRVALMTAARRSPSTSRVVNDGRGERVLKRLERSAEGDTSPAAAAVSMEWRGELGEGHPTRAGGRHAAALANSSAGEPKKTMLARRHSLGEVVRQKGEPSREWRLGGVGKEQQCKRHGSAAGGER